MKAKLLVLLLVCFFTAKSQQQQLIAEAVKLEAAFQEAAALDKLAQVLKAEPTNYFALWKSSELHSRLGIAQPTKAKQMAYYTRAQRLAQQAIKVLPKGAEGYYALSVAMGRLALAGPTKEKIAAVKAIKENAEKALQLNPGHGRAWHVLGKWHFEVSGLNMMERTAVKVFYGGFPPASTQQSIRAYEKAQSLEPAFALNHLELAKAYIRNNEEAKAKALLQQLASLPTRTGDDNRVKAEGKELLRSIN
ncbi:hypothetical protein [Paracnuella aquatica]|uniref:hypothetical protein n=1 Tax=Paracnuella aquatica TaxID=2268757 RepID=UPI000DEFC5CD|nr:hypothetical protein [Paracnuella aquatica]RPD51356.1 hypothetical protein DRJ53_01340 [Paracnuella aquatica]